MPERAHNAFGFAARQLGRLESLVAELSERVARLEANNDRRPGASETMENDHDDERQAVR
jgi:hypothetical protein